MSMVHFFGGSGLFIFLHRPRKEEQEPAYHGPVSM